MIDFHLIIQSLPQFFKGLLLTLQISLTACVIGLFLGTLLGILQKSCMRLFVCFYVTVFRGTPMLVQILFVFYVLPQLGINISPIWSATLAIGLNSAAYISQIIVTGINAVSKGQLEAAKVLGMGPVLTTRCIILPQVFKLVLPALGNEVITLVKDSSLASIIGVMELSKQASVIRSRTYDAFSTLLALALIYLLLTSALSLLLKKLEARWSSC